MHIRLASYLQPGYFTSALLRNKGDKKKKYMQIVIICHLHIYFNLILNIPIKLHKTFYFETIKEQIQLMQFIAVIKIYYVTYSSDTNYLT